MKHSTRFNLSFFLLLLLPFSNLLAQSWNFAKENEGIKLYTRNQPNSSIKSFKGELTFHASVEKIFDLLGNPHNTDWWDKGISQMRLIAYEKDKYFQYYIVYDMPWPIANRDMVVDTKIMTNAASGERTVTTKPLTSGAVPEKQEFVRLHSFLQKWTVQPLDKGNVHITLEGFIDPGGNVPAWLYNMVITETPLRAIRSLRDRALSPKPARD